MKAQDPSRIRKQLELIAQWRASGLSKAQWAAQQGIEPKHLMGWLTYEGRWKERLSGQAPTPKANTTGFAPVHISPSSMAVSATPPSQPAPPPAPQPTVRIEYTPASTAANRPTADQTRITLHWPISHSAQLAHFLGLVSQS